MKRDGADTVGTLFTCLKILSPNLKYQLPSKNFNAFLSEDFVNVFELSVLISV